MANWCPSAKPISLYIIDISSRSIPLLQPGEIRIVSRLRTWTVGASSHQEASSFPLLSHEIILLRQEESVPEGFAKRAVFTNWTRVSQLCRLSLITELLDTNPTSWGIIFKLNEASWVNDPSSKCWRRVIQTRRHQTHDKWQKGEKKRFYLQVKVLLYILYMCFYC